MLALNGLFSREPSAATHFAANAKNVIFCFMDGGPSHVDTFDYKPILKKHQGQPIGSSWTSKRSDSNAGPKVLRARVLVEAGVRFVEITHPSFDGNNSPWDQHAQFKANHEKMPASLSNPSPHTSSRRCSDEV